MRKIPLSLQLRNATRWISEHLLLWAFLAVIYSFTAAQLLEPMTTKLMGAEVPVTQVWIWIWASLSVPVLIALMPWSAPRMLSGLSAALPIASLGRVLVRHELRSIRVWIGLLASVLAAVWLTSVLKERALAALVLAAQAPVHVILVRIESWRRIFALTLPKTGAHALLRGLLALSVLFSLLFSLSCAWILSFSLAQGFALVCASAGAAFGACAVSLEGDSGRPFLVNLIAITTGSIVGLLCLWKPAFLILGAVFYLYQESRAGLRLRVVERVDEDIVFS